jgi:eukaryotic-like serine/threonine-protein kinase
MIPTANNLPVPVGTVIAEKYRVDRVLGVGGMGIVAVGRHLGLDIKIAIKMLLPSVVIDPDTMARFVREARAATRVTSEHVVKVIDVGATDNGAPFMVMEYLEGADLAKTIRDGGPLSHETAVDYILQACEALAEAHGLGIVHRDIKPANIFVARKADGTPLIKVLDFGVSKLQRHPQALEAEELTLSNMVIGSPHYMSPEQLRSPKDVDARADIWALGALLYKLITGKSPFVGESVADLSVAVLMRAAPRLIEQRPDVPPELDAIVARCLEKSVDARFATVGDLAQALLPIASTDGQSSIRTILRVTAAPRVGHSSAPPPMSALPSARLSSSSGVEAASDDSVSIQLTAGGSMSSDVEPRARFRAVWIAIPLVFATIALICGLYALRHPPSSDPKPLVAEPNHVVAPVSSDVPGVASSMPAPVVASADVPATSASASASAKPHASSGTHAAAAQKSHSVPHGPSAPPALSASASPPPHQEGLSEFGGRT